MTVSSSTSRSDYTGNGVTTAFTGAFRIIDQTHIIVYRTQISTGAVTTLAITTDYTVSGVGGATFTVTTLVAPTTDQRLSILRNVPLTQEYHYVPNDPFPAASHENALDLAAMRDQQLGEVQSRSLTLSPTSSGVSSVLPNPSALQIIGWNASGTALANYDATSLAGGVATVNWSSNLFSGNGSTTSFVLSGTPGSVNNCDVSIGGVVQRPNTDYTLSASTITFTAAPPSGTNNILVRYGTTLPASTTGDGTVTTAKIVDKAVTLAKLADVATATFLGRTTAGTGVPEAMTAAQAAGVLANSLSAAGKVQSITATRASNAITTTVAPTSLDFRSSTLTTGAPNTRTLGSADTVTIPALASLGVPTGQSGRIVRLLIDNGGTLEGAVINLAGGVNLDETGLISTTAISGTATAANVAYSTTARTNVPYRVVGFFDAVWTSGTGWSAPTLVQGQGGQALAAMQSLGFGQTWQTVTRTNGTTYYNTTGKPIIFTVIAIGVTAANNYPVISVGGIAAANGSAVAATNNSSASAVIPAGASYSWTISGGSSSSSATELR